MSNLKIDQIFDSIDERTRRSIAAELKIDVKLVSVTLTSTPPDSSSRSRSRVARLTLAEQYLRQCHQIGDPRSGEAWVEGHAAMGWKPLQDGKTVLFCGYAGSLLVALGGSVSNVLGYPASENQVGSYTATIREAVSGSGLPGEFWRDLEATSREICVMPQRVRFLARVLSRHCPDADSGGTAIVLATPLYVELDDRPAAGQLARAAMPAPAAPGPEARAGLEVAPAPKDPRHVGPYEVVRRIGAGAMGVVYQVRDRSGRDLALKVIRPEHAQDPAFRQRFAMEAQTALRIRDASVAALVDAAVDADPPYLVAEYAEGPTIEERVSRDGPLSRRESIGAGRGVAAGLAAIHGAGFIHGDLTPSNVILSPAGPKVIDLGIARSAASGRDGRADQLRMGTPAYMSPEQIQHEQLTPASDVFSWASLMVYATTGHPAFGRTSRIGVFWEIQEDEPDLTDVPASIREIISAALAKDPAARPSADELIRHLPAADDPRPLPPARSRLCRLAPALGAAIVSVAVVSVVLSLTSSNSPLSPSGTARRPVLQAPVTGSPAGSLKNPDFAPAKVVFSPDGKSLAVGSIGKRGGATYVWDIATRQLTATLTAPANPPMLSLAYAPGGQTLAAVAGDNIYLWNTATRKVTSVLSYASDPYPNALAYAPHGPEAAEAASNIYLWNTSTNQITGTIDNPVRNSDFTDIAYAPDGQTIAADEGTSGRTYLWNATTRALSATFPAPAGQYAGPIAWSPDGHTLAIGGGFGQGDGNTYLWNTMTRKRVAILADPKGLEVNDIAWAPGGQVLATSDQNGSVYLWDTATGKITATLSDPGSKGAFSAAFSPDGSVLAVADGNGTTYLWRIRLATSTSPASTPRT